jgi:hypothetical protein
LTGTLPAGGPLAVPLSGTGVAPAPIVSLSSSGVIFAMQALGATSAPQTVTVRNTGNATLNIQTVALTGSNSGDLAIASGSSCANGSTVAANGSCAIQLTFTPTAPGARSAVVSITDNAADSPETISLSGSEPPVPALGLSPSSLTYPAQFVGTTGLPQTVTVTDNGAVANSVTITPVTAAPGDFGVLNNCSNPIAVGGSCTIGVFFDPTSSGTRTGTLTITNSAAGNQTVTLTGNGEDFSLTTSSAFTATVTPGQTASYSIVVAPAGGFAQSVALSCSGGPVQSMCAVSPSMISLSGSSGTAATVTLTTRANGSAQPFGNGRPTDTLLKQIPLIVTVIVMLLMKAVSSLRQTRGQRFRWASAVALTTVLFFGMTLTSCGGGGSGGSNPQAGTYTITVTANFASGSTTLSHATKLTLVVQ